MGDLLDEIKQKRKLVVWFNEPTEGMTVDWRDYLDWMIAEIDRLRANQIPGYCKDCYFFEEEVCKIQPDREGGYKPKEPKDFCHEWEPKGTDD